MLKYKKNFFFLTCSGYFDGVDEESAIVVLVYGLEALYWIILNTDKTWRIESFAL